MLTLYYNLIVETYCDGKMWADKKSLSIVSNSKKEIADKVLSFIKEVCQDEDDEIFSDYDYADNKEAIKKIKNALREFKKGTCNSFDLNDVDLVFDNEGSSEDSITRIALICLYPTERELVIKVTPQEYEALLAIRKCQN